MGPRLEPRVLLGIGGGIAAYKSAELVRRLRERGCDVRVVMTSAATELVAPLTFQALSGHPVRTALFDPQAEAGMDHIELARWPQVLVFAPATADLIARLAAGLADDLATTLALASDAPLFLAPAMNHRMWLHPATQANLRVLSERGARILGPAEGAQACGEHGPGRMSEPGEIADALMDHLDRTSGAEPELDGVRVLVSAGPTLEPIDPVRYIGNRSSGRMGYALAEAFAALGARVALVSGPTSLVPPAGIEVARVETALEMHAAVMQRVADCDLFAASAAVADYRPAEPFGGKIKKDDRELTVRLVPNPDILAEVAARPDGPFTLGFAAETDRVEEYAAAKLQAKGLDMIAANRVGAERGGFEREENALVVLWPGARHALDMMPKPRLARALAALVARRYREARSATLSGRS